MHTSRTRTANNSLTLLILMYFLLAGWTGLNTPLFEAPDAYYHFGVIHHLATSGELPPKENRLPWRQMTYHAPLYHLIASLLARPFDLGDFPSAYPLNPHAQVGEPGASGNVNFVAHTGDPWRSTGMAVRAGRVFSIALGALTLLGTYWLARGIFPSEPRVALLAVAVTMFNPQFLFINSVITNDTLVTALSTVSLAAVVWMIRHGVTWRIVLALSVLLALDALAKASGLVLYPVALAGLLWACWQERRPLRTIATAVIMLIAVWAVIAGWWYWDNWQQFGDPTAATQIAEAMGQRRHITDLIGELRGLYYSFWGLFGWFNVPAPGAFYTWTALLLGAAGAGLVWRTVKGWREHHRGDLAIIALMIFYVVLFIASWGRFHLMVNAAQGRLWFPLIGVFAMGIAFGLARLPRFVPGLLLAGMALAAVSFPALIIAPRYKPAPSIDAALWPPPESAVAFHFREPWNDDSCLTLWTTPVTWDGQSAVTVDYWWQSDCQITGYWSVFLHFVDVQRETCIAGDTGYILAQTDTMPDRGNRPFPGLSPGRVFHDTLSVEPPEGLNPARSWHVQTGLYDAGGTFIRAFVTSEAASPDISIGQCGPETVVYRLLRSDKS